MSTPTPAPAPAPATPTKKPGSWAIGAVKIMLLIVILFLVAGFFIDAAKVWSGETPPYPGAKGYSPPNGAEGERW